jgi:GDPmannose 4,6-dehydratase
VTKRALITGILGQDGSYLAELLLKKNMTVLGTTAPGEQPRSPRWLDSDVIPELMEADLADADAMREVVSGFDPDEVYHLAAQSSVAASFEDPLATFDITGSGALRVLEAVRTQAPTARVMLACSAEMFGQAEETPQTENTLICPVNPYAVAKTAAYHGARVYREAMGVAVSCAILYNHESPRRGDGFVTRKIARGAAQIARGKASELLLGNLQAQRDWGAAQDYVRAMWLMLQRPKPDDFIIATGQARSVGDFCDAAFNHVGLHWQDHVRVSEEFFRPTDPALMCGNSSKAREMLGWQPEISFEQMVAAMVDAELALLDGPSQK